MLRYEVVCALENLAEQRVVWNKARKEFQDNVDLIMRRLINEAAVNMMSAREVADASGLTLARVRRLMRENNLNPRNGKRLLAEQASKTLLANAELLDQEPHEFDLMSPLAYLPMGKAMRDELVQSRTPSVTEFPETAITASIHLGIMAEQDWEGPSIKPGTLTNEQIAWLGSWLAGDGVTK